MSYIEDLSAITTPSLTDLLYIYQNGDDFKITNQQLLDLIKTNTVIPLTQAQYDALTPAEKNNGSIYIITDGSITADDVEYSSGVSVKDILDIQTNDNVLSASWIAQSQTTGDTPLTDYLTLTKGFYLVIVAYPVLDNNDSLLSDIIGANISKWGGSFIQLSSQQNSVRLVRVNADTQIRVNSMQSKNVNFTYLDRGGLFAYRLA